MPENHDAVRVWAAVQDQIIFVVEGQAEALGRIIIHSRPLAIRHGAIHQAMDTYRVADRRRCFDKVLRLSREFIADVD